MSEEPDMPHEPRSTTGRLMRLLVGAIVVAVVIVVLFTTVFPWVEQRTQVPTIGTAGWTDVRMVGSD